MICKNCNHSFKGKFCNNCGQSSETHKINAHFIWHDIQHGLFHFDNGLLYSIKELYLRPGHSIREFIEGKRVRHLKPISLVIILATIYGFLYHFFKINLFTPAGRDTSLLNLDINEWVAKHYSWLTLGTIPLYTLGTYIAFRNQGFNYFEYFVLNTFKASQRLILHIITFPLLYYYNGTPSIKSITEIIYIADILLIYWTNFQFFDKLTKIKVLLLSLFSHLVFLISLTLILTALILLNG